MNRTQELLSEFVQLYRVFFPKKNLAETIYDLNSGLCYFVAGAVGAVLKKEGFDVKGAQHCHHAWIVVDGVHYDTMYPNGYSEPVSKAWLLDVMKINDRETIYETDKKVSLSLVGDDPYYACFLHAWCLRHGLEMEEKVVHCLSKSLLKGWRKDHSRVTGKLRQRFSRALSLTYTKEPLPEGLVYPLTHYFFDSVEPDYTRPLKPYPFMRSVKTHKFLIRDLRKNGTPLARM